MSNGRISMNKIREILRLREESGLSDRKIGRALSISRPVVAHYLADYKASGLAWDKITAMNDEELLKIFESKRSKESVKYQQLSEKFEYFVRELKKTGVTIGSLWEDYHKEHSDGYAKSQFCYYFQVWRNSCEVTMHLEHKAGEKSFVDFTGKKMTVYDRKTGIGRPVETMVAILGASQLTYAEATESQKKEDWIKANVNALNYFGGVPLAIVPDCLKSAVTDGNQYEADINPEYNDFARHYGAVILPARPNCPQDKALAEGAVKIIYMRIFAPLRNSIFYSLEELNEAVWEKLEIHNNTMFQRMKITRREFFNETEKSVLKPLPADPYELRKFLSLKVQFNYHIAFSPDTHYYSVPWQNKGA